MEYTITKNDTTADLELTYNPEDIENAFGKAYEKAAKKAKIDGFRPGKAPIAIVKKVLGESVTQDALNILLSNSLENIQSKLEFKTFGDPKIEIQKYERKEKLIAKASYELAPETKIGTYKNLSLKTFNVILTDESIQDHLFDIQYQLSKVSIKEPDEVIESTDLVKMDFLSKDMETNETTQQKDAHLHFMGRNSLNLQLEENLIGMKVNEEKEFEFTYPENLKEKHLSGKKFFYHVKIIEIFTVQLPELDDALANEWDENFQTLDDLKVKLKENLKKNAEASFQQMYFDNMLLKIIDDSTYKIPNSMIQTEIDHIYHESLHELKVGHIPMEKFAELIGRDLSEVKNTYEEKALLNIKKILSIYKIAEVESISVGKEELESAFDTYRQNVKPEKLKEIDLNRVVRNLHENILIDKVYRFLYDNSSKTIEDIKFEEIGETISK